MSDPQTQIISLDRYRRLKKDKALVDPVITHWPCRIGICRKPCGVTQTAIEAFELFNAELMRRRDKPLREDECMYCDEHAERRRHAFR